MFGPKCHLQGRAVEQDLSVESLSAEIPPSARSAGSYKYSWAHPAGPQTPFPSLGGHRGSRDRRVALRC